MQNIKKLNARTEKWREMISKGIHSDQSLLKKRVRKGIPPCLRMIAWPLLIRLEDFKKKARYEYQQLLKQESLSAHDICLDVPRTFPQEQAKVLTNSLYCVLKAVSIVHPEVGYCQGMNFLCMRLLEILDDEIAFWMMDYLLRTFTELSNNYRSPETVQIQNHVFTRLFAKHLKDVHSVCEQQMITPLLFTTPWFITFFSSLLPKQLFCRIFECLLSEGYKIIYRAGLAIMKHKEKHILENSLEKNIVYVGKPQELESIDPDVFVETMFSFSISRNELAEYEAEYRGANRDKIAKMEREAKLAYEKRSKTAAKYEQLEQEGMEDYKINISQFSKLPFQLMYTQE